MARAGAALLVDLRTGAGGGISAGVGAGCREIRTLPYSGVPPEPASLTALPSNTSRLGAGDAAWCVVRGRRLKEGGSEPGYQREGPING